MWPPFIATSGPHSLLLLLNVRTQWNLLPSVKAESAKCVHTVSWHKVPTQNVSELAKLMNIGELCVVLH